MPLLEKILNTGSGRKLKQYEKQITAVNAWEEELQLFGDEELKNRIGEIRKAVAEGDSVQAHLVEVFAIVREASKRTLHMRHFDVQMMGGMAISEGNIAEMRTGEGKTLTGTLPIILHALEGKGVHVVTVNDYLAKRDAEWMMPLYNFLGISVGILQNEDSTEEKKQAYKADVTYGTNSEFGFDYLRDNLAWDRDDQVARGYHFAIVDEVDNILIDEARTPLIISGLPENSSKLYQSFARVAKQMKSGEKPADYNPRIHRSWQADYDYEVDEKHKSVSITDQGVANAEKLLGIDHLYRPDSSHLVNHLLQALKAESLYKKDRDYAVVDGEVHIIDEFTGRILEGRRWSEGLHQAVEAKEGVEIQAENLTVASITYQNFFRKYHTLAGMTGTASTEATELQKIYKLEVVEIPPNRPVQRVDHEDLVFATKEAKWKSVVEEVKELNAKGQPVLVGTVSVSDSEMLSKLLGKENIKHTILNAKPEYAEREGITIAQAGRLNAVTIATNMAGRGVDIKLGGDLEGLAEEKFNSLPAKQKQNTSKEEIIESLRAEIEAEGTKVRELGGLAIIGTERHESRRIDNQLRGRSGRQGDPGETRFYLSAEDDLLRLFGGDMMKRTLLAMGGGDAPIKHRMLTKRIEGAQKKVEEKNFLERKHVLEYDDVMNRQREAVYSWRDKILDGDNLKEQIEQRISGSFYSIVSEYTESAFSEEWEYADLLSRISTIYPTKLSIEDLQKLESREEIAELIFEESLVEYNRREEKIGSEHMRQFERMLVLQVLDERWREHLQDMDYMRDSIHLRGLAQVEPLVAYKNEASNLFEEFVKDVWIQFTSIIFNVELTVEQNGEVISTAESMTPPKNSPASQPDQKMNRAQRREQARKNKKGK